MWKGKGMQCAFSDDEPVADMVCELPPATPDARDVFLHALADTMPECDRRLDRMSRLEDLDHARRCYVYCAQKSCDAAGKFMAQNAADLRQKCDTIVYLHNGSLAMQQSDLQDGARCHSQILKYNEADAGSTCVTCDEASSTPVNLEIDKRPVTGHLLRTKEGIPDWYYRRGIYSELPPQFTCDTRYRTPPTLHAKGPSVVRVNLPSDMPKNATLGFWAAQPSDTVKEASEAYGDFSNSGIVECIDRVCDMPMHIPGRYTVDGREFPAHIHFTQLDGDRWSLDAQTINLE